MSESLPMEVYRQYFIISNNPKPSEFYHLYTYREKPYYEEISHWWDSFRKYYDRVKVISDMEDKLKYLIYCFNGCDYGFITEDFTNLLDYLTPHIQERIPKFLGFEFETRFLEDIDEECYLPKVVMDNQELYSSVPLSFLGCGFDDSIYEWLDEHNIDIWEFIENPKYSIIIEHNSRRFFKELWEAGCINPDSIENMDEVLEVLES